MKSKEPKKREPASLWKWYNENPMVANSILSAVLVTGEVGRRVLRQQAVRRVREGNRQYHVAMRAQVQALQERAAAERREEFARRWREGDFDILLR